MQVSVEEISSVERRLTITVPADQVEAAYAKQMSKLATQAKVPGFRPGKAPKTVLQQRYGNEARSEALNEVIQQALYEALAQKNLRPINVPQVEPKSMLANQALEFTALFEILPELATVNFSLTNLDKPVVEIKDDDLNRVLDQLRKQYTKWNAVEREVKEGDRVVIDYYAIFEGKSDIDNKIQNLPLEIGSKVMMPGFEEGLIGMKVNEERTLNLTFPNNVEDEKAGKPIDFVVLIKQILEAEMPELDEKFAKQLGIKSGNIDDLKQQIKQSLEHERDRLVKEKVKEQIFSKLLEQNPIDVPKSLVAREAKNIHDEVYPAHQHHDHHQHTDEETAAFNDIAKKRVALSLLISEYAKKANIVPEKTRVEKRIQEIASVYENPQEVIQFLTSDENRRGIEAQVTEDMVMDKLLEGVPVTEKIMSYAELKGIRI